MKNIIIIILTAILLTSCASSKKNPEAIPAQPAVMSPAMKSELAYGKQLFKDGYYKRAMQQLLPLAAEGSMEAQYAVGYMYYYGFGVPQDTDSGYFWIKRSADQRYEPAINALVMIQKEQAKFGKATTKQF
ncbi:MAG TPA: hypothetical protein VL360_03045 [Gammaproteobacteria bacterium]|jgi:TPR repeat protein|nr:hypothetical protein [Gammaproteobacteria bacterium]